MDTQLITNNLFNILNHATIEQFENGLSWYDEARQFCHDLSIESNIPFISVCAALAALSPRNKWERNKMDCRALCLDDRAHKFATFTSNVNKAKAVLLTTNKKTIIKLLSGKKVISFFENIYDENSQAVTVDVWMLLAAMGSKIREDERPSLTQMRYDLISDALTRIAHDNNLRPYEAQAVIWVTFREMTND